MNIKEMIKNNARWVGLAAVAVPVLIFTVGPMLPGADILISNEPTVVNVPSIDPVSSGLELAKTATHSLPIATLTIEAPPQHVVVTPPIAMSIVLNKNAMAVIKKTTNINLKQLDVTLENELANEREAKVKHLNTDAMGLEFSSPVYMQSVNSASDVIPDVLSQLMLNSLITSNGRTSAYISIEGSVPVRVTKGSELAGIKVNSVTDKGVSVSFNNKSRFLAGASYE